MSHSLKLKPRGVSQFNGGTLYLADYLAEVPSDIAAFSLGCGDPITLAGLRAGDVVVDLGAGGGLDCLMAAKRVGETGRVIGVDMTPEMLARACANAARVGARNAEFRQGYIEALPVGDGEATVVISNCVINLPPDKPRVFRDPPGLKAWGPAGCFGYCQEWAVARDHPE